MAQLTGGEALVQSLVREGLDTIFVLPGVQLDWAFDALYAARDRITVYHTRHEQATAYMADGFARASGKIGACMVVPGPGVLNAGAALATAYAVSSPVLCVAGQVPTAAIDRGYGMLHEIPRQREVLGAITKWTGRASAPADVPGVVHEAFRQLRSGRPRPVAVEMSPDVLMATGEVTLLESAQPERSAGDPDLLKQAAEMLRQAERPVICSGGGVLLAAAWEELRAVAEMLQAPVVMSTDGRGAVSDRSPLAHTGLSGRDLVAEADVVLAVGTRFWIPARGWGLPPGARVIRIDADPEEIVRHGEPEIAIVGDAKAALGTLRDALDGTQRPSRAAELHARKERGLELLDPIQPQVAYYDAIRAALPDDGVVIGDLTQVSYVMTLGFPVYEPRTFIGPGYQGTLGSGLGTALGAQAGVPSRKVVAVMGDGGFLYQVEELATMKQHGLNIVALVFNDNAYGNVRRGQRQMFDGHVIASDLVNPDFVALAEAFGIRGARVESPDGLRVALAEALAADEPALIEIAVGEMPSAWHLVAPLGGGYPVLLP